MTTKLEDFKSTNISEITDNYRKQGYQILVKPRGTDLHEFMSNNHLDFIIHSTEKLVVLAVKPRLDSSTAKELNSKQIPDLYDYPRRDSYDIQVYLARLLEILEMGVFDSSICSAVFIAEAVMRMVAEQHAIDFEPQVPKMLAQTFFAYGFLTQEDYEVLVRAIELRDRMMFKREKVTIDPNLPYQTVEVVQRLFSQVDREENEI
jgi:REase_AHJR-like